MSPFRSAAVGAVVWVGVVAWMLPTPFHTDWAVALLLLAPLVLVPLVLGRDGGDTRLDRVIALSQPPAAVLLVAAFVLPEGTTAGVLTVPWLAVSGLIALSGLVRLRRTEWVGNVGRMFLVVGGGWTAMSRLGMRPLDFEPVIVLLTAIHFHYAGFVLPVVAGWIERTRPDRLIRVAAVGVALGVPAVAVGITATQLKFAPLLEALAGWWTAAAAGLVAVAQIRLAVRGPGARAARGLWGVSAVALVVGMGLAALYAGRPYLSVAWLDIPWMRALHGTAEALGFALAGVLGWCCGRAGQGR